MLMITSNTYNVAEYTSPPALRAWLLSLRRYSRVAVMRIENAQRKRDDNLTII